MIGKNLYLVEHIITDKEGWTTFENQWMDAMCSEDMTIDKGLQNPELEGIECLLSCVSSNGDMAFCFNKAPSGMTLAGFSDFIDCLTGEFASNKYYAVAETTGIQVLDGHGYMHDFINITKGRASHGYLDAPMLWFVHHHITDPKGWKIKVVGGLADTISKKCNNPSDVKTMLFQKGYDASLSLMLGENDAICLWSAPEGTTQEEYQKVVDIFTKGSATNTTYLIDTDASINVMNLAEDNYWNVELFARGKSQVKIMPGEGADVMATQGIHIETQ